MARRRSSGVATYIRELQSEIQTIAPTEIRIRFVAGPPGLPQRNRLTSLGNLLLDIVWTHVLLPLQAWLRRAALVHSTVNWAPWWCPCPVVVTIHDLAWERFPDDYPRGFRMYASLFARRSARRARRVITDSQATADDVVSLYSTPRDRVRAIHLGVRVPHGRASVPREPLILCVSVLHRRKRIVDLVRGHKMYMDSAPADPPPCRLVIVGGPSGDEGAVAAAAGPECEIRGFVDTLELDGLYRRATLFVYPSSYEGFGLPVAEAMARGCPVLVARNSSLPEVAGESGLYLDETTPQAIAAALREALADREALAQRGGDARRDAEALTWRATADATLDVYREALTP